MNIFGKNIKMLRHKKGWGQKQIADLLNISVAAYSKIESGITDVNFSRMAQIAIAFDVKIYELISKDDQNPKKQTNIQINDLKEKLTDVNLEVIKLQERAISLFEEIRNCK